MDISKFMQNSSLMVSNVLRARIDISCLWVGFIPGTFSTIIGAMISGLAVFKRQTAQLFKELET